MITRRRRLNLLLSLIVVFSLISATTGQATLAGSPTNGPPEVPQLNPPPGRNGLGMGQAENGNPADVPVQLMDGVNVTNGNLFLSDLHFQFNGIGPAFGLQIAYNAQANSALSPYTPLGRKWTHNLNWYVDLDAAGNLLVHKGDGEIVSYPLSCRQDVNRSGGPIDVFDIQLDAGHWNTALGNPGYNPIYDVEVPLDDQVDIRDVQVVGAAFNLTCGQVDQRYWLWNETQGDAITSRIVWQPGGDVELHTREGVVYRFFSPLTLGLTAGKLQGVTDRNANSTTLLYDAGGLLIAANNTSGASLQFTYSTSACSVPVISTVTDHTGRVVTYQYGAGCNLIGVERYGTPWHSYGYLPGNLLATDTNALGQATTYGYDTSARASCPCSCQEPPPRRPTTTVRPASRS